MTYKADNYEMIEAVTLIPEESPTPTLLEVLSYRRGFDTEGEKVFIKKHIKPLEKRQGNALMYKEDEFGNVLVIVGEGEDEDRPRIVHNAHTDSCHSGRNPSVYQSLAICNDGRVRLLDHVNTLPVSHNPNTLDHLQFGNAGKKGKKIIRGNKADRVNSTFVEVLGADDGTGLYLMLHMINEGVPGYYLFTRGEEVGGQGANYILSDTSENGLLQYLPEQIELIISYDRKGTDSIITEQMCGTCMGDDACALFAAALLDTTNRVLGWDRDGLTEFSGIFVNDPTGSYTDSAAFFDLPNVKHVTNLSVGYYDQHTQRESQELGFVEHLLNVLVSMDWYNLDEKLNLLTSDPEDKSGNSTTSFYGYESRSKNNTYAGLVAGYEKVEDAEFTEEADSKVVDEYLQQVIASSPYCSYCVRVDDAAFEDPECMACGALEDAEHLLAEDELGVEDLFDDLPESLGKEENEDEEGKQ